ncbi:MAG TPA: cytochrome c [Chitinophagaceae bacterium]|nr:cytochrome c [Chitinophagaceae bacterium]
MKRYSIITGCVLAVVLISCDNTRRNPGRADMPDMTYSPAYETYAPAQERLKASGAADEAHYTGQPVAGTIARGEQMPVRMSADTVGYRMSASVKNPLPVASINMKEAERLYLVNCGICHGAKLDGNGPLYNGGAGPYTAAPKNLMGDDMKLLSEGTMFHAVTYGKGQMGSYASQLTTKQRWEVIAYVKAKQFPADAAAADTTAKPAAAPDSVAAPTTN